MFTEVVSSFFWKPRSAYVWNGMVWMDLCGIYAIKEFALPKHGDTLVRVCSNQVWIPSNFANSNQCMAFMYKWSWNCGSFCNVKNSHVFLDIGLMQDRVDL